MTSLSHQRLRELLHYDPTTGAFTWKVDRPPGAKIGQQPRCRTKAGYLRASIDGILHYQHRLAWFYMHGMWPSRSLDHINGDRQDNRIENLRDVSHSTNLQNLKHARADSKTGLIGVHRRSDNGKFSARIFVNGKNRSIGSFDSAEAAHAAYINAKRNLHEGCTL